MFFYNLLLKPIWTYDIQFWGSAKKSNANKIQIFQSKVLRLITNAPLYMSNFTLHNNLNISLIRDIVKQCYNKFHSHFVQHVNPLIVKPSSQSHPGNPPER